MNYSAFQPLPDLGKVIRNPTTGVDTHICLRQNPYAGSLWLDNETPTLTIGLAHDIKLAQALSIDPTQEIGEGSAACSLVARGIFVECMTGPADKRKIAASTGRITLSLLQADPTHTRDLLVCLDTYFQAVFGIQGVLCVTSRADDLDPAALSALN